jgi:hypothetical protein
MPRVPPKSTIEDVARPVLLEPNAGEKSPAPAMVVEAWCIGVERMDRRALDRFTRTSGSGSTTGTSSRSSGRFPGAAACSRRSSARSGLESAPSNG